jgi:hydrogenase/urease accessory protein HupE
MRRVALATLIAAFALAPPIALAHTGHAETSGLMYGLTHPITGIDHVSRDSSSASISCSRASAGSSSDWD